MRRLTGRRKWKVGLGFVIGLSAAVATVRWPSHAGPIEMGLYTAIVFMGLLFSFWPERRTNGFGKGLLCAILVHAVIMLLIRNIVPVTIFVLLPIAFVEFVLMAILMFHFIGEE